MKKFDLDNFKIEPHHILVAQTSYPDYEMSRDILLEIGWDSYVIVRGYHCSCYGFDDTDWDAIEYTLEELRKLADAPYNETDFFWQQAKKQIGGN